MENDLIQNQWARFERMVLNGAPAYQKMQMKDAFFAGAAVTIEIIIGANNKNFTRAKATEILNSVIIENRTYAERAILENLDSPEC